MIDNAPHFLANPSAFIVQNPIAVTALGETALPPLDNLRTRFTLSSRSSDGVPTLQVLPLAEPAPVTLTLPEGRLSTIDALYCRVGRSGDAADALPFCDIVAVPGDDDPQVLFTPGMQGCSLIVATAVPGSATPLPRGCWRVLLDPDCRSLAAWHAAGYTVRFAAYVDGMDGAGPLPDWPAPPVVANYNPRGHTFTVTTPRAPEPAVRVVTNFLWWCGANWTFNSRHFAAMGSNAFDLDALPPGGRSAQSLVI